MAASGYVGILTSVRASVPVSSMETESEWPLETTNSFLSGLSSRWDGDKPTATFFTFNVLASITLTVPDAEDPVTGSVRICDPLDGAVVSPDEVRRPPRLLTKTLASWLTTANGAIPTSISRTISCVVVSTTASVFDRLKATYAVLPSGEKAMPTGRGCPLSSIWVVFSGRPVSESWAIAMLSGPLRVASLAHNSRSPGRKAMPE